MVRGAKVSLLALAFAAVTACSSDSADESPFNDANVTGATSNKEGAAYPTEDLGGNARTGSQRGDRIPNFSFQAYPDSNIEGGIQTISLADYYDPEQKRAKVLHLMLAAVWCPICDGMTRDMISMQSDLGEKGVVVLQVLMDGKRRGISPSLTDVQSWITRFPTPFTVGIDARAKRIGTITEIEAVPWSAFVDLRTMEILVTGVGQPVSYADTINAVVEWVNTHPPSY